MKSLAAVIGWIMVGVIAVVLASMVTEAVASGFREMAITIEAS